MRIEFGVCPNSSGEIFGSYSFISGNIFIDTKAIAYRYDETLGDRFTEVLSKVIEHEYIHRVIHNHVDENTSRRFDNIEFTELE